VTRLILRYPNNEYKEVEFDQPRYRVGSAEDNELVIEQEGVSPHQAEIEQIEGNFSIVDLSEDKSTTVNGKPVERNNLNYGDRISFGPVTCLFYPVKQSRVSDRAKLFLYMGAGALVIVISIVLIFYLTSRQISTVVSERLGKEIATGEVTGKIPYEGAPQKEKEKAIEKGGVKKEEKRFSVPALKGGFFKARKPESAKLNLPEPDRQTIETRTAVAVPRGIERIFFRKIPVIVQGEETASLPEEEAGGGEVKKGIFQKILAPVNRLLKTESGSVPETPVEPLPPVEPPPQDNAASEQGGAPGEVSGTAPERAEAAPKVEKPVESVAKEDIERILNPLSAISVQDIPQVSEELFKEEPLYGAEKAPEEQKTLEESALSGGLSQSESYNFDLVWKYPEGLDKLEPIVRAGTVLKFERKGSYVYLFSTKSGNLVAVNGQSGEEIFSEDLGNPFYDPAAAYLGGKKTKDIIVTFEGGNIAVYTVNLERLWVYDGSDPITSLPLISDVNGDRVPDIIIPTFNMDVIALDGSTGFELWRYFDAESDIVHPPVAADINGDSVLDVLFCTRMGWLYALDGKTGWSLWKREILGIPAGPPTVADLDGDGNDEVITLTRNGLLTSYSREGKLLFTQDTGSEYDIAPSVGDVDNDKHNEIVTIDKNGVVKVMEGKTRREEWDFETDEGGVLGRVALADLSNSGGLDVVFCTLSGALFVLDGKSGAQIAQYNLESHCLATPIIADINDDGISEILIGSYAGEVFALKLSDVKKKFLSFRKSFWISSNHDYRNTGASSSYFLKLPWK
jgi:outer membrane protein assembly factor BamB